MIRSLTLLSTCLLLVTGCAGPVMDETKAPTTTTAQQDLTVSPKTSCATLLGDDGGLVSKSAQFLVDITELSVDSAKESKVLAGELSDVASTANDELRGLVKGMQEPFDDIVAAFENGTDYTIDSEKYKSAGHQVIDICSKTSQSSTADAVATPSLTPPPPGLFYRLSCSINATESTEFTDYKAAWSRPFDSCTAVGSVGTPSAAEKAAASGYGGSKPDSAKYLYSLCAATKGHYIDGAVTGAQAKEITGALSLCPDHPKRVQLEANAAAGLSWESDLSNGKLVSSGKYLVGKAAQPGTWQSQGEKVEDCYWEISDAQGNILDNNFISVAPQVTIHVPATAAGFTVEGCLFRWIGE